MKKILTTALAMLVAITFVGCKGEVDYVYTSYYTYTNDSSRAIDIKFYDYISTGSYYEGNNNYVKNLEFSFRIPAGASHTLRFHSEGGYSDPFMWGSLNGRDSLNVSNGLKQFGYICFPLDMAKLFQQDSYQIIKPAKKKRRRTYQYIFTDADFENATPIE